ncbi:MAG TPA: DUF1573 domain-containing protein [Gemmatales bacterium]|nr:DUF1573 domain-containing protein [Gemmatales bacterium]HMP58531.1 DUF1573 domain-containing protein [Gemmatales bacterium]
MRFWLSLILCTIAISTFLTFINEYQGANLEVVTVTPTSPTADTAQPEFVTDANAAVKREAYTFEISGPAAVVGQKAQYRFNFKNQGAGPLEIEFKSKSCGCAGLEIDGKPMTKAGDKVTIAPGAAGVIVFEWKPEADHYAEMKKTDAKFFRYGFEFLTNERRYTESLRFEIQSEIKATP